MIIHYPTFPDLTLRFLWSVSCLSHFAWEDLDVMKIKKIALPNIDIHYPTFPEEIDIKIISLFRISCLY